MKRSHSWSRRDFIAKPAAFLAASRMLGGSEFLFGESTPTDSPAPKVEAGAKPITRTLGKTGMTLPIVSMGVINADVSGLVRRSYELGIRHFETAAIYEEGRDEEMLGTMIKEMGVRDKVTIATKVMRPGFRPGPNAKQDRVYSTAEVKTHFDEVFAGSLKRLKTDYVEILYNHSCDSEQEINSEGALEALTEHKKAGRTRWIGVSSHQPERALKLAMQSGVYDVVLIQFNYTMAEDESLLKTIDEAAKSGIGVIAMKTLAGGTRRIGLAEGGQPLLANPTAMLKWVLRHESIATIISGWTTYDQLDQNFAVASDLTLTPEEHAFLSDRRAVQEAQFCRQCGQCRADCPLGVDIPQLMRSHMYAVQYADHALAAQTMAAIPRGRGLVACDHCDSCQAKCRNSVDIARKIRRLKEIASIGRMSV